MLKFEDPPRTQFSVVGIIALGLAAILVFTKGLWSAAPLALIAAYMFIRAKRAKQ